MLCPHCGTNNLDTNAYCSQCGQPLRPGRLPGDTRPQSTAPPIPSRPEPGPPESPVPGWHASPPGQSSTARSALPQIGALAAVPGPNAPLIACGVCGAALYAGQARCLRCQTRPGTIVNPNDPTATDSLPFGPPVPLTALFRAGDNRRVDEQGDRMRGWNWGAALLPTMWAARHRVGWLAGVSGLLSTLLISLYLLRAALHRTPDASGTLTGFLVICALLFGVPRSIYAALRGNTFALRSGIYPDRETLRKAQRTWSVWAIIGVAVLALLLGVASAMLNAA